MILDLADLAKRENNLIEAKYLFKIVTLIQPQAYQGWLEWAKIEEECGQFEECSQILLSGLKQVP